MRRWPAGFALFLAVNAGAVNGPPPAAETSPPFCQRKFAKPVYTAWADVACDRIKHLKQAPPPFAEFYFRARNHEWSGYEFPLAREEIRELFKLEGEIDALRGAPVPYVLLRVTDDFAAAKIPRTGAALSFFMRATEFSDGAHSESIAGEFVTSFNRSPEQFLAVLQALEGEQPGAVGRVAKFVDFGDTSVDKPLAKKSILAALRLEKKSATTLKSFFDYLRTVKDR